MMMKPGKNARKAEAALMAAARQRTDCQQDKSGIVRRLKAAAAARRQAVNQQAGAYGFEPPVVDGVSLHPRDDIADPRPHDGEGEQQGQRLGQDRRA